MIESPLWVPLSYQCQFLTNGAVINSQWNNWIIYYLAILHISGSNNVLQGSWHSFDGSTCHHATINYPNTRQSGCLWHIFQNPAKHLNQVIKNHPKFHAVFKKWVCEKSCVAYFSFRIGGHIGAIRNYTTPSVQCTAMNCPSFMTGEFLLNIMGH